MLLLSKKIHSHYKNRNKKCRSSEYKFLIHFWRWDLKLKKILIPTYFAVLPISWLPGLKLGFHNSWKIDENYRKSEVIFRMKFCSFKSNEILNRTSRSQDTSNLSFQTRGEKAVFDFNDKIKLELGIWHYCKFNSKTFLVVMSAK